MTPEQQLAIIQTVEEFNDLARNEIVKAAYHFKQAEGCINRLNKLVEILHDEELIPSDDDGEIKPKTVQTYQDDC